MVALNTNETQAQVLTNALAEGLLLFDQEGVLQYINPEAARLLEWNPEETLGVRTHRDMHDPSVPQDEEMYLVSRVLKTQRVVKLEGEKIYRAKGGSFTAWVVASPVVENRTVVGCAVALLDLSESSHQMEELQESLVRIKQQRRFYKAIYDGVQDGVVL